MVKILCYSGVLMFIIFCCTKRSDPEKLFEEVHEKSNIHFANNLEYTEELNPYTYKNFYNGGGVALGDINNDGLLDIYFSGNMVDNKLFLNVGDFQFKDITEKAKVACSDVWSTGVTYADVNGDGLLDLYVCKSGPPGGEDRHNELFINNGDLTFTEKAKEYGLDIVGLSTDAAFFDFDKDGDLDCYVLTNPINSVGRYNITEGLREIPDSTGGGNKLLLNNNGKFEDITLDAGIYSSSIGFGLGITLSDFNQDNWTDIFISNDFFERDYLYINDQKGGFKESLEEYMQSISMGSMGADVADFNNDLLPDILVTEMLPDSLSRKKTKAVYESWETYASKVEKGYHYQFPRNVLHRNYDKRFLEIGRFSGVADTEWSWAALIFDMNNDGLKDAFIANGIFKDLLDRDYLAYTANDMAIRRLINTQNDVITKLIDQMPSQAVVNGAFRNIGDFRFEDVSDKWGFSPPTFSNGSAYGDLDNDGDLDLVINNVNMPAHVYKNKTDTTTHRSIRIELRDPSGKNTHAIGAKVIAKCDDQFFLTENYTNRGFQSSIDPVLHIGVGEYKVVDSLFIHWPDSNVSLYTNLSTNRTYTFNKDSELFQKTLPVLKRSKNSSGLAASKIEIDFIHNENDFRDFDKEKLLPQMYHNLGPGIAKGDIDGDGDEDLFIGGAKGQTGKLFVFEKNCFKNKPVKAIENDKISEDAQSCFVDVDNDGDLDLYVGSGGRAFSTSSTALKDRLYINDGYGNFTRSEVELPFKNFISTSAVEVSDYDQDGDQDIFVGERFHPFFYGIGGRGYLLENNGKGKFTNVTENKANSLLDIGMVTDAKWADLNGDDYPDLIIASDWGPIYIFINKESNLVNATQQFGLKNTNGWWNTIEVEDIDSDGDWDIIAGNHGTNSFFKPGDRMYVKDFDGNGFVDQIICKKVGDKFYPYHDRDELLTQMLQLKEKLRYYKDYANLSIDQLFGSELLEKAKIYDIDMVETTIFKNENGKFQKEHLPSEIQYAPVYAIGLIDLDRDSNLELIFGGNQYLVKPRFGRYDASLGWVIQNDNKRPMEKLIPQSIGIDGQIRDIEIIQLNNRSIVIFGINDGKVELLESNNQ